MADTLSSKTKNLPVEAVQRAVAALAAGGMVVVVDDEDRENEGDLLIPAESVTAPRMTFLVAHTTGIVCAPMTCDRCEALRLPQMVADNTDAHGTAFTVSVDHVGAGTGVSSAARAKTIHALADPATAPSELRRPLRRPNYAGPGTSSPSGPAMAGCWSRRLRALRRRWSGRP